MQVEREIHDDDLPHSLYHTDWPGKGQLTLWWPPQEYDYARARRHENDFLAYEMDEGIRNAFGST